MTHLLLAIALLAQAPETTLPPTAAEIARLDLGFCYAVEDSIAREPGTNVPAAYAGLIDLLGCDSYRGRVDATTRLESAVRRDPSALRWVFWGRRDKDPEIRVRCNAILRRATATPPCSTCKDGLFYDGKCWVCRGLKSLWTYGPWD